ncbi:MAG: response regulator [Gammaproteobacteria bacterium]|nr:response regulator [Gammaproteobacteria bacterium]
MSNTNKKNILIVDDCPEAIHLLSVLLKNTYNVQAATSSRDALEIIFSDCRLDLILLDVIMPEMNGYEMIQKLKEDDRSAGIPVMFLTSKDGWFDEELGYKLGAVDFISKPVRPEFFLPRIEDLLTPSIYDSYAAASTCISPITEEAEVL